MDVEGIGLFGRLWLFFVLPWRVLFDGVLAGRVQAVIAGEWPRVAEPRPALPAPEPAPEPALVEPEPVPEAQPGTDPTSALQLLGILQREGRFVDFLQEDVNQASDADIGAAARVVHAGCRAGVAEYLEIQAVRPEAEGDPVVLEAGFDATCTRLTGNVTGEPPFRGTLAHHGWRVTRIDLPTVAEGHDPRVVAPAEVEL